MMDLPVGGVSSAGQSEIRAISPPTLGLVFEEAVDLGNGTVVGDDGEAVVSGVQDQVLTHDGQTDEAEITTGIRRRDADIDAGKTGAIVSRMSSCQ